MTKINQYEIINHGFEYSDYFQWCGVAFTEYTLAVTGIGGNEREAFEDALEQLAMADYDTTGLETLIDNCSTKGIELSEDDLANMDEYPYCHVSIRVR